jgi:Flp pilus assembly protein TadG
MHGMKALRSRRGAVAALSAVVLIPVLGFAGLAIDLTRIWMVNARLKTAIDAAALVAARQIDLPTRDAEARRLYWANFTQNGRSPTYLGASLGEAQITPIPSADPLLPPTRIQVTGTATVNTTLFSIISRQATLISDTAIAERQGTGLELSLVLDVTGSMGVANIQALRGAATDLVDILYAGQERQPNLWVSVVPYTSVVNIGAGRTAWLQAGVLDAADYEPTTWQGCVEARVGANYGGAFDETETPPSVAPFRPHLWRTNRTTYSINPADPLNREVLVYRNNQLPVVSVFPLLPTDVPVNRGDNPWIPGPGGTVVTNGTAAWSDAVWQPDHADPGTDAQDAARGNSARGPNLGCGRPVMPLTRDRTPILAQIAALRHTHRGGTMANLGLQLGWGTLSPLWRDDWSLGEFRQGQRLPLDYGTANMTKAIVLMTDGENQWYDEPTGAPGRCNTTAGGNPDTGSPCVTANLGSLPNPVWSTNRVNNPQWITNGDADQTSYGRLRDGRLGATITTNGQARAEIDARMARLCEAVKARGITVYTIVFVASPSAAITDLYRGCASRPENFFPAPTRETLNAAFRSIAGQLANLRLAQ